jgi:hypothetical protein
VYFFDGLSSRLHIFISVYCLGRLSSGSCLNGPRMAENGCWRDNTHVVLGGVDGDVNQTWLSIADFFILRLVRVRTKDCVPLLCLILIEERGLRIISNFSTGLCFR